MSNSQCIYVSQLSVVFIAFCLLLCHGEYGGSGHRPNIVLFLADDMGYGDVGCYGNENVSTPNIDKLSQEGLTFTRMYSQPVCTPTRGSILTGRYPVRYGMVPDFNAPIGILRVPVFSSNAQPGGLPWSEEPFLSTLLKSHGYRQAMIGKWHLGVGKDGIHLPMNYGFDMFFGIPESHYTSCTTNARYRQTDHHIFFLIFFKMSPLIAVVTILIFTAFCFKLLSRKATVALSVALCVFLLSFRIYLSFLLFNPKSCILMRNYDILEQPYREENMTLRLTKEAQQFTSSAISDNQPFFLFMSHLQVHIPPFTSPTFKNKSGLGPYHDSIMELDWSIGVIVNQLKTLGVYNNTIIIFASDNGPELTNPVTGIVNLPETLGSTILVRDNKEKIQLRGEKLTVWEGGIRVPAVITWPGNIQPGRKTEAVSSLMDIFPTIRDILQDKVLEKEMDGKSLLPLLRNLEARSPHEVLMHYCDTVSAVTYGDYKVHFRTCDGVTLDNPELFNIVDDPGEMNPLPLSRYENVMAEVTSAVNQHQATLSLFPSQFSQLIRPWLYLCANFPFCRKSLAEEEYFDDLFNIEIG